MIDLRLFINQIKNMASSNEKVTESSIISFLEDNDWFGKKPTYTSGKVEITEEQEMLFTEKLYLFINTTEEDSNSSLLLKMLTEKFPLTEKYLSDFYNSKELSEETRLHVTDFLLYEMEKDLMLYKDKEIVALLKKASFDMIKEHGECLTYFLSWLRTKTQTAYVREYIMEKRYTMDVQNEAYSTDDYLQLLYYLFNEDYIEDNEMYVKAAKSKNYIDTWLYLSIHFICSLRFTDLIRIYHPDLPYSPELVLERIADGTFTDNEARMILLTITKRLCLLPLYPNKTTSGGDTSGVDPIKFEIPSSCEVHIGKLFALAEAHRQLNGNPKEPIIRKINTYEAITRYMGDEIGSLFLEADFRSRSATKSYLQSIFMLSDYEDSENRGPNVKGYILASLARSHKGSYGEFAETTSVYLKDAKFNGLTPEFIAFELLERGVLSFVPATLLKMATFGTFDDLSVKNQTKLIKKLNITPRETESLMYALDKAQAQAQNIIQQMVNNDVDILTALHRVGSGQAVSKEPESLCIMTAIGKFCPFKTKRQCVGCEYEISTKATLFLLIGEFNRNNHLYHDAKTDMEKQKYKHMITNLILPKMNEMLLCLNELHGEEVFNQYEEIIKENVHGC